MFLRIFGAATQIKGALLSIISFGVSGQLSYGSVTIVGSCIDQKVVGIDF